MAERPRRPQSRLRSAAPPATSPRHGLSSSTSPPEEEEPRDALPFRPPPPLGRDVALPPPPFSLSLAPPPPPPLKRSRKKRQHRVAHDVSIPLPPPPRRRLTRRSKRQEETPRRLLQEKHGHSNNSNSVTVTLKNYDYQGRCVRHPHVQLRKKVLFGRSSNWKLLLAACPDCCTEELRGTLSSGERKLQSVNNSSKQSANESSAWRSCFSSNLTSRASSRDDTNDVGIGNRRAKGDLIAGLADNRLRNYDSLRSAARGQGRGGINRSYMCKKDSLLMASPATNTHDSQGPNKSDLSISTCSSLAESNLRSSTPCTSSFNSWDEENPSLVDEGESEAASPTLPSVIEAASRMPPPVTAGEGGLASPFPLPELADVHDGDRCRHILKSTISSLDGGEYGDISDDGGEANATTRPSVLLSPISPVDLDDIRDDDNLSNYASENIGDEGDRTTKVTITVLSLHGIVAKKKRASRNKLKQKGSSRKKNSNNRTDNEAATVVASFSVSKDGAISTHVPSLPVSLSPGITASISSLSLTNDDIGGDGEAVRPVAYWPATNDLSTLQFQRRFTREECGARGGFVCQTCPINLSISRNGKMAPLGRADLIINGRERGETPVMVPITNSILARKKSGLSSSIRLAKNAAATVKDKMQRGSARQNQDAALARIEGDAYQFGLESPVLTVLVEVSDQNLGSTAVAAKDDGEVLSNGERLSAKGDDSPPFDRDRYYGVNHCMAENEDDSGTLRRRLAELEQANEKLCVELTNARRWIAKQQEENEQLRWKLELTTHNAEALLNELDTANFEGHEFV